MRNIEADSGPTKTDRLGLLLSAVGLLAVFAVAFWLEPDARGFGTHEQLGLPPCQLRQFVGVSCPHCGMTTCFSNVVRGNFRAAVEANPLGIPLSITWALCIPWCLAVSISGRWIGTKDPFQWLIGATILYLILAVVLWVVRIFT